MRRLSIALLVLVTLVPAAGVIAATWVVPSSAYALPTFEFATKKGPVRLTAEQLGARRTDDGLHIDQRQFDRALTKLEKMYGRPAVPGTYELTPDHRVHLKHGTSGLQIDRIAMRGMLLRALRGTRSGLKLPIREVAAPEAPSRAIVVTLNEFRLDLYAGPRRLRSFAVGVGALRFPTPPGAYYVRSKAMNPSWRNPGSGWARGMPAYIPPGPRNPLGTRALRLDRGALVIHGTPQPWSIGQRSSHGCIRMRRDDIERLYEAVPQNTPVFIVP